MKVPRNAVWPARVVSPCALAVGLAGVRGPGATAASASAGPGYLRLATLSPNPPPVDVYLYSFGNASALVVLHHVGYGDVSQYEQVASGEYTVAMRAAGAAPASKPVLSTTIDVLSGHAYTVAGLGPLAGLRLQVIASSLAVTRPRALVRVIQASMHNNSVTRSVGRAALRRGLRFHPGHPYH